MPRKRIAAATFGLAAILLVASGIAIHELPGSCGEVGRPNLDWFARLTLVAAGGLWVAAVITASDRWRATGGDRKLAAVALLEACVGIGLLLYYRHHTGWYDHCG